ncbi:MAG: aminotransferase class I/II-fold pyridoxal phosphate-dependent enzyme [Lachnospiraceae bacterium]|nr:aminotransferase class I/II-fold pyridoxal phosphate-dependent enzyme [Lachnospiraceae bacterium]
MGVQSIHGGDIYRNQVDIDFSVNVNPFGTPEAVIRAMYRAVEQCGRYPDIEAEKLKRSVGGQLAIPEEYLLFGNGASELFMAVIHGIKPKKTVIPVPSFYGYEYAARAAESEIFYYEMKPKDNFCVTSEIYDVLPKDTELLFLANPNNPTGALLDKEAIKAFLRHCEERRIYVLLDECFIEFSGEEKSLRSEVEQFNNLIVVRTFTKIFTIPGARLGYLVCKNKPLLRKIAGQIPEWNLSCFAQEAGCACAGQTDFIHRTKEYVRQERVFLEDGLRRQGFRIFPSMANFILLYREEGACERTLYTQMLEQGILIRDCKNFRGLGRGFYRVAVKSREENEKLLQAVAKILRDNSSDSVCRF